jgi:ABC-2 type transport system ATP-binding protein
MGLDVGYRRLFIDFLREYVAKRGTTVLLTSHVVQELDKIVDNMIVLREGRVAVSGSKKEFMDSFRCYSFARSPASDALHADTVLENVEHMGSVTTVYAFADGETVARHLRDRGVDPQNMTPVPMDFEDAFVGLTGKY